MSHEQVKEVKQQPAGSDGNQQSSNARDEAINLLREDSQAGRRDAGSSGSQNMQLHGAEFEDDGSISFGGKESGGIDWDRIKDKIQDKCHPPKPKPGHEHDENGNVTEVTYPNGDKREFGYNDDGELVKIVQPDGTVISRLGNNWISIEDGKIKVHDINNPHVDYDGNFSYSTDKGVRITYNADGTVDKKIIGRPWPGRPHPDRPNLPPDWEDIKPTRDQAPQELDLPGRPPRF